MSKSRVECLIMVYMCLQLCLWLRAMCLHHWIVEHSLWWSLPMSVCTVAQCLNVLKDTPGHYDSVRS